MKLFHFNKLIRFVFPVVLAVAVLFCAPAARAADLELEAVIDRSVIELGSYLQLTVSASGTQSLDAPELPDIESVQVRYLGPSTRVSIVNGEYSKSISFNYNLFPTKVGKFQIPAMTVTYGGGTYSTNPINFEVVAAEEAGGPSGQADSLQDKIFLVFQLPKKTFYENEKVPVSVRMFVNDLRVQNLHYPTFDHDGFMEDEYLKPSETSQVIGGVRYQVYEFKKYIYPTRTGELSLGPAKLVCDILFKSQDSGKRRSSGMGNFFNDSFFDSFFESYDTRSVTLESVDMTVTVLPLPEAGKPANFSNAVGKFAFEMSVSPTDVKEGDPVTVKMRIAGDGNLKNVDPPALEKLSGIKQNFKFYDPQTSDQDDQKTIEQVVIPKNADVSEFPEVNFSYFDTSRGEYVTLKKGPFPLKVERLEAGEQMKVVGWTPEGEQAPQNEVFGKDISYIKRKIGRLQPIGYRLNKTFLFNFFIWAALLCWAGAVGYFRFTHKIKTDERFAKRLLAPRNARAGLMKAKEHLDRKAPKDFYDTLFKTLQAYLCNKFHIASGAVSYESVEEIILSKGLTGSVLANIKAVFEECEMTRYASAALNEDKMRASFHRAEKIIDFLERNAR